MKVLVLSDIHDNVWNLQKVLDAQSGQIDALITLGDYCAPFVSKYLKKFDVPSYACLGNNDGDHIGLLEHAGEKFSWFNLSQEYGRVELDGMKIAFCHYPRVAELLAKTDAYNAVFYGHTHRVRDELYGETRLANPGAVCGIVSGVPGKASYMIYDTDTNEPYVVEL